MTRSLTLTTDPFNESALIAARCMGPGMGAAITFSGVVRGREAGEPIVAIDYEAFVPMAERQFNLLFDQLAERWPTLESVRLIHRLGVVRVNEASLWVEIISPHRGEAFAACQWLIEEMKRVVPIWKKPVPPTIG